MAQKRVKKEDRNQAYVPRSFSESKYEMGKCWGLSTSVPKKVNPLPKVSLAFLACPGWPHVCVSCPPPPTAFWTGHVREPQEERRRVAAIQKAVWRWGADGGDSRVCRKLVPARHAAS